VATLSVPAGRRARTKKAGGGVTRAFFSNRKAVIGFGIFVVLLVLSLFPSLFTSVQNPTDPAQFDPRLPAGSDHWMGTTSQGQDIWALFIYGAREPMIMALVAGGLATALSVLVGVSAAYLGGWIDEVLSMITNIVLVIPQFPLAIVVAAYFAGAKMWVLIFILVFTGWSYGANQMRAQALSLRNRDFMESARVRGERSLYIILFEALPTMVSLILATFLNAALYSVITAAGLQFLGLGDPNSDSWGIMLHWAEQQAALETGTPWWAMAPALGIAALGVSFALMNYAFDEISNPALRPVRRQRVRTALGRPAPAAAVPAPADGE
jgi:peptide/nickel transport system permease protein